MPPIEARLRHLSKDQLLALIHRMVLRHEDLDLLVEQAAGDAVGTEAVRAQVARAFEGGGYHWGAAFDVAEELELVIDLGDACAARGDWPQAAAVYRTTLEGIAEAYETVRDDEGELARVAQDCIEKMGGCLPHADPATRETILQGLFEAYAWDVGLGGYGIADAAPDLLTEQTTPEERAVVAQWVHVTLSTEIPGETAFSSTWRRARFGTLLLALEADVLDDATYLARCREAGLWTRLVARLLERERLDEAVDEAGRVGDHELLPIADLFAQHGHADRVAPVVQVRAQTDQGARFVPWLQQQAEARGDYAEALALRERLFWPHPTIEHYAELRRLAQRLGRWEQVGADLEDRLSRAQRYGFLTQLHLFEDELPQALHYLEAAEQKTGHARASGDTYALTLRVARAAEEPLPQEAVRLYRRAAGAMIAQRGRRSYATAAKHLQRVRDLYLRQAQTEAWERCLQDVREQHRRLPALLDEMKRAGL